MDCVLLGIYRVRPHTQLAVGVCMVQTSVCTNVVGGCVFFILLRPQHIIVAAVASAHRNSMTAEQQRNHIVYILLFYCFPALRRIVYEYILRGVGFYIILHSRISIHNTHNIFRCRCVAHSFHFGHPPKTSSHHVRMRKKGKFKQNAVMSVCPSVNREKLQ